MSGLGPVLLRELRLARATARLYLVLAALVLVSAFVFCEHLADLRHGLALAARLEPGRLATLGLQGRVIVPWAMTLGELLVLVVPLLVVPLFHVDRRRGGEQLLQAAPLAPLTVISGKWLAGWALVVLGLGLGATPVLMLELLAPGAVADWPALAGAGLGLVLLAGGLCALAAAGAVALDSQATALVLACLFFLLWMAGWAASGLAGPAGHVLHLLDARGHLAACARGTPALVDLVYGPVLMFAGIAGALGGWYWRSWR